MKTVTLVIIRLPHKRCKVALPTTLPPPMSTLVTTASDHPTATITKPRSVPSPSPCKSQQPTHNLKNPAHLSLLLMLCKYKAAVTMVQTMITAALYYLNKIVLIYSTLHQTTCNKQFVFSLCMYKIIPYFDDRI